VLFCGLDGFKVVNDTEGHAAGDDLLRQVAAVIAGSVRADDVVARLGGDEFAVLLPAGPSRDPQDAESLCRRLIGRVAAIRGDGLLGVSIGLVASGDGDGHPDRDEADGLLGDADLAMYEAKAAGGGHWIRFEPAMRERVLARARLRTDLER
jgi:diguanylate cyclase (GGDEF)-like protein